jgi:hypothetical protein
MARNLDGGTDYINLGDVLDQSGYTDFSAGIWFRVGTFDTAWQTVFSKGDSSWRISRVSSSANVAGSHGLFPNESTITSAGGVDDGAYHHGLITWDDSATDFEFYLDGVSEGTDNTNDSAIDNAYEARLGENDEPDSREWEGDLCEFVFYDRVLTATQALALYKGVSPMRLSPENLLAYLPVHGNDTTEQDWSGAGITGTLAGTTKIPHAAVELLENSL